jgi:hypothetical protein
MKNRLMVQKFQKDFDAIDAEAGRQMRTTTSLARVSARNSNSSDNEMRV